MIVDLAVWLAKRRLSSADSAARYDQDATQSTDQYRQWRRATLEKDVRDSFDPALFFRRDVLDFGCGTGELSLLLADLGARSVIGIDLSKRDIEAARKNIGGRTSVAFRVGGTKTISLPDRSIDVIACFDVMEHIMEYDAIMREWRRVLRPGGRVLIDWQPYYHPYGHHARAYMPIPWAHVFLSPLQQNEVCARVVDLPEFKAPWWDHNGQGQRINRFREAIENGRGNDPGFLNELTMRRFEKVCREVGFEIERRKLFPFSGPSYVKALGTLLTTIPFVREFCSAKVVYTLAGD